MVDNDTPRHQAVLIEFDRKIEEAWKTTSFALIHFRRKEFHFQRLFQASVPPGTDRVLDGVNPWGFKKWAEPEPQGS